MKTLNTVNDIWTESVVNLSRFEISESNLRVSVQDTIDKLSNVTTSENAQWLAKHFATLLKRTVAINDKVMRKTELSRIASQIGFVQLGDI